MIFYFIIKIYYRIIMSLIQSLLVGSEGSYSFLGVNVTFQKTPLTKPSDCGILRIVKKCLNSHFFL